MQTAPALRIRMETASVTTGRMSPVRRIRYMDLASAGTDGTIRPAVEMDPPMGTDMVMDADKGDGECLTHACGGRTFG